MNKNSLIVGIAENKNSLILKAADLACELRVSTTTLWRMTRDGRIPAPIKLSERAIGWRRSDIEIWLQNK